MGASNFATTENANKIYAVLTNETVSSKTCTECGTQHEDHYYDLETLVTCDMGCKGVDLSLVEVVTEEVPPTEDRCDELKAYVGELLEAEGGEAEDTYIGGCSYATTILGSLTNETTYAGVGVEVKITATITSAYYEGASLDYLVEAYNGYEFIDVGAGRNASELNDVLFDLFEDSDLNAGLQVIQVKHAKNWAEAKILELSNKMDNIFERVATHKLEVAARFSNGETIYTAVK